MDLFRYLSGFLLLTIFQEIFRLPVKAAARHGGQVQAVWESPLASGIGFRESPGESI